MGLEKWALIAEIGGAAAVVLSVIYLAVQVSDNNRLLRSQAHYNALELAQGPIEMLVNNERLAEIIVECDMDPGAVSPVDWERCANYYFILFNGWEYLYYQNRDGSIPPQLFRGADALFKEYARTKPGYRRFWSDFEVAFDEPFRSYAGAAFLPTD
jgi:hypothetical protein